MVLINIKSHFFFLIVFVSKFPFEIQTLNIRRTFHYKRVEVLEGYGKCCEYSNKVLEGKYVYNLKCVKDQWWKKEVKILL